MKLEKIGGVLLGIAALVGVVAVLTTRDRSTLHGQTGPGVEIRPSAGATGAAQTTPFGPIPATSGAHANAAVARDGVRLTADQVLHALELGDVVIVYRDSGAERPLRVLAAAMAAPFSPALAAAGDAVVLDRDPRYVGITALAWRHALRAASPADPALARFVSYWVGLGAHHR